MGSYSSSHTSVDNANKQLATQDTSIGIGSQARNATAARDQAQNFGSSSRNNQIVESGALSFGTSAKNNRYTAAGGISLGDKSTGNTIYSSDSQIIEQVSDTMENLFSAALGASRESLDSAKQVFQATQEENAKQSPALSLVDKLKYPILAVIAGITAIFILKDKKK